VAALALALGYLLVVEAAGHLIVATLATVSRPDRYVLSTYVYAWLNNGHDYSYVTYCPEQPGAPLRGGDLACDDRRRGRRARGIRRGAAGVGVRRLPPPRRRVRPAGP
jgi:hypothetical protein